MRSNHAEDNSVVQVELKYCEHCGGLWVRERGSGEVYCDRCLTKVEDLPVPKKRARLPVAKRSVVEDYRSRPECDNAPDLKAMRGVA